MLQFVVFVQKPIFSPKLLKAILHGQQKIFKKRKSENPFKNLTKIDQKRCGKKFFGHQYFLNQYFRKKFL